MSVDQIEDLHLKDTYGIGDVKTKSSRYPIKKVQELCGPNAGDWCVLQTVLEDGFKIYAIGHRRGGEVHTFIASCGLTIAGTPQAHREDMGVYGNMEPRKCPKVLNTWSQQQPKIDSNNRYRQNILAIEERFVTRSFPFRMLTTTLGITFANAYEWFCYFINKTQFDDFLLFMRDLSYDAMHNNYDAMTAGVAPPTPNATRAAGSASPRRQSPRQIASEHRLCNIRMIYGYKGSAKQMCAICQDNNHKTSSCCAKCSDAQAVFAIHPKCVKYKGTIEYDCLAVHLADPDNPEHKRNRALSTGKKRGGHRKRRRCSDDDTDDE